MANIDLNLSKKQFLGFISVKNKRSKISHLGNFGKLRDDLSCTVYSTVHLVDFLWEMDGTGVRKERKT